MAKIRRGFFGGLAGNAAMMARRFQPFRSTRRSHFVAQRLRNRGSYRSKFYRPRRSRKVNKRFNARFRRRALFNQQGPNSRLIRLKNTFEATYYGVLSNSSPGTTMTRSQAIHNNWMPPSDKIVMNEQIWNAYDSHKLMKFTWRMDNFRIFITTRTQLAAVTTPIATPAVIDSSTVEMPEWKIWYWRMWYSSNTFPPPNDAEHSMSSFCHKNCKDGIWGKVNVRPDMNIPTQSNYAAWLTTMGNNSDTALNLLKVPAVDTTGGIQNMPSPDIYMMPDDPFPSAFYNQAGTSKTVEFTMTMDCHSYTTWRLMKSRVQ